MSKRPPDSRRKPAAPTPVAADDRALFLEAIGSVRRIESDRQDTRAPAPAAEPVQSRRDDARVMEELLRPLPSSLDPDAAEPLRYLKNGIAPRILLKLGRGQYSVRDELDLHQMTAAVAREAIARFLGECKARDFLCVKIIHGKGLRSRHDGPVLKALTDRLLRQRGDVLAFRSARFNDGGSGAVVVLLKGTR
ncbi:MAG: Smr/MutS family protein [Xanthomonadales bacterium]|nr:Smr/MutS family protein [Xanthomonadales bacterium]MBK7145238.1 Smr/MutS family protein [Xanthomonadales bacterium]MCC6560360.1 Smr/MutS family protein [Xanthomonadales bacterium]